MNPADTLATVQMHFSQHSETVLVSTADTDELGHVSNLAYLQWVQEIAKGHSAARGLDLQAYQRLGGVFVVRRHEIEYHRPVRVDEQVQLHTWVSAWGAATSRRETRMFRTENEELVCSATTRWAFVDLQTARPTRIPRSVREAFG